MELLRICIGRQWLKIKVDFYFPRLVGSKMDVTARTAMVTRDVPLYLWWGALMPRLDATENDETARKWIEDAVFELDRYESRYQRNQFLQLAAVGFPEEFRRLCAGKWQREEGFAPKYLSKKWLEVAALRVKALYWKQKIKEERQMLATMQQEHKLVLQQLKELGDDEGE